MNRLSTWPLDLFAWVIARPWLGLVAAAALVIGIAVRNHIAARRHRRFADNARLVTIAPPPEVDPKSAAVLWANLHGLLTPSRRQRLLHGTPHLVWQYAWTGRQLTISLWVPGTVPPGAVEAAARAAWPAAACTTQPATMPLPDTVTAIGGALSPVLPEWLPINADHDLDPLRPLVSAGAQLRDGEHAVVQILARPATPRRVGRARRAATRLRDGKTATPMINPAAPVNALLDALLPGPSTRGSRSTPARRNPHLERDVRAIVDKTSHPMWQAGIRYAVATSHTRRGTDPRRRLRGIADALASSYAVYAGRNRLAHRTKISNPVGVLGARRLGPGFLLSQPELAALAALPQDLSVPGLDRARAKSVPAPVAVRGGGRGVKILGDAEVGGHTVSMAAADARYHTHMVGSTGSGKTTLLANMILADIEAGRGTVVIDPHGDLVLDVLDRLDPDKVKGRIVLFDPDQPNPPNLNPLEGGDDDLTVDNIVAIFSSIFSKAWGPRMDDVMRVSCLTLLRHANVTLQHIPPLLNSAQFRSAMTVDLDDPSGLGGFWSWYDEMNPAMRSQVIGPVLARLRAFLLRDFVAQAMRYPRSSFDMADILNGGVLLVRIPKGQLGEDTSKLLGSLILARVWQAATARAKIPADQRRDASLYLDEAQNFLNLASSVDTMLAEARKYRLSMTLAHQDLAQFPKDLLAALSSNARNKLYFSCAPEDARVLARHTDPELSEHDLSHLDAYTAVARLVVDGRQTSAFTLKTRPPRATVGQTNVIRQQAAEAVTAQDTSAIDTLVKTLSTKPDPNAGRQKRPSKNPAA